MDRDIQQAREIIAQYSHELYLRRLTDATGGNVSIRIGDKVLMTPTLAGELHHWKLTPRQILVLDMDGTILDGDGRVSREARAHFTLLREFYPRVTCVMHTHALNVMVFCAANKDMVPVLHATDPFGVIRQTRDEASETDALAEAVLERMRETNSLESARAACCMAPRHGLFVMATDIHVAFEITERVDTNAWCILQGANLGITYPGA